MNLETTLKWASVASLTALLVLLAQQLAPNFIEYAQAEAYERSQELLETEARLTQRDLQRERELFRKFDRRHARDPQSVAPGNATMGNVTNGEREDIPEPHNAD